eukprot:augustus_masked-scaffold_9-processed-gene-3.8-mRNA-1 protein AED:0.48 eAED:0.48 QI:0/-1/0/1/-1/1/1/0/2420
MAVNMFLSGVPLSQLRPQRRPRSTRGEGSSDRLVTQLLGLGDLLYTTNGGNESHREESTTDNVEAMVDNLVPASEGTADISDAAVPELITPNPRRRRINMGEEIGASNVNDADLMTMSINNLEDFLHVLQVGRRSNFDKTKLLEYLPYLGVSNEDCISILDMDRVVHILEGLRGSSHTLKQEAVAELGSAIISLRNYATYSDDCEVEVQVPSLLLSLNLELVLKEHLSESLKQGHDDDCIKLMQIAEAFLTVFLNGPLAAHKKCWLWFIQPRRSGSYLSSILKVSRKTARNLVSTYILDHMELATPTPSLRESSENDEMHGQVITSKQIEHLWIHYLFDPSWCIKYGNAQSEMLSLALSKGCSISVLKQIVHPVDGCRANVNPEKERVRGTGLPLVIAGTARNLPLSIREEWSGEAVNFLLEMGASITPLIPKNQLSKVSEEVQSLLSTKMESYGFTTAAKEAILKHFEKYSFPVTVEDKVHSSFDISTVFFEDDKKYFNKQFIPSICETLLESISDSLQRQYIKISVISRAVELLNFVLAHISSAELKAIFFGKMDLFRGYLKCLSFASIKKLSGNPAVLVCSILSIFFSLGLDVEKHVALTLVRLGLYNFIIQHAGEIVKEKLSLVKETPVHESLAQTCSYLRTGQAIGLESLDKLLQNTPSFDPIKLSHLDKLDTDVTFHELVSSTLVDDLWQYFQHGKGSGEVSEHLTRFFSIFTLPSTTYAQSAANSQQADSTAIDSAGLSHSISEPISESSDAPIILDTIDRAMQSLSIGEDETENTFYKLLLLLQTHASEHILSLFSFETNVFTNSTGEVCNSRVYGKANTLRSLLETFTLRLQLLQGRENGSDLKHITVEASPLTSMLSLRQQILRSFRGVLVGNKRYADFGTQIEGCFVQFSCEVSGAISGLVLCYEALLGSHLVALPDGQLSWFALDTINVVVGKKVFDSGDVGFPAFPFKPDIFRSQDLKAGSSVLVWHNGGATTEKLLSRSEQFQFSGDLSDVSATISPGWKAAEIINVVDGAFDVKYRHLFSLEQEGIFNPGKEVEICADRVQQDNIKTGQQQQNIDIVDPESNASSDVIGFLEGAYFVTQETKTVFHVDAPDVTLVKSCPINYEVFEKGVSRERIISCSELYEVNSQPNFSVYLIPKQDSPDQGENVQSSFMEIVGRIEARYMGKSRFYSGRVVRENADKSYDISYDDADTERHVPSHLIRGLVSKGTRANESNCEFRNMFSPNQSRMLYKKMRESVPGIGISDENEHTFLSRGFLHQLEFLSSFKSTLESSGKGIFAKFQSYKDAVLLQRNLMTLSEQCGDFSVSIEYNRYGKPPQKVIDEVLARKHNSIQKKNQKVSSSQVEAYENLRKVIKKKGYGIKSSISMGQRVHIRSKAVKARADVSWREGTYLGTCTGLAYSHICVLDSGQMLYGVPLKDIHVSGLSSTSEKLRFVSKERRMFDENNDFRVLSQETNPDMIQYSNEVRAIIHSYSVDHKVLNKWFQGDSNASTPNQNVEKEQCTLSAAGISSPELRREFSAFGSSKALRYLELDETGTQAICDGNKRIGEETYLVPDISVVLRSKLKETHLVSTDDTTLLQVLEDLGCFHVGRVPKGQGYFQTRGWDRFQRLSLDLRVSDTDTPESPRKRGDPTKNIFNGIPSLKLLKLFFHEVSVNKENVEEDLGGVKKLLPWRNKLLNLQMDKQFKDIFFVTGRLQKLGLVKALLVQFPFLFKGSLRRKFFTLFKSGFSRCLALLQDELTGYEEKKKKLAQLTVEFQRFFSGGSNINLRTMDLGSLLSLRSDDNLVQYEELQVKCDLLEDELKGIENREFIGRLNENLAKVGRQVQGQLLEDTSRLMKNHLNSRSRLLVQFSGENASGDGVTSEFYAAFAQDLLQESNNKYVPLFANTSAESATVFVQPLLPQTSVNEAISRNNKVIQRFELLGRVFAKAFLDYQTVPIPFDDLFFYLLQAYAEACEEGTPSSLALSPKEFCKMGKLIEGGQNNGVVSSLLELQQSEEQGSSDLKLYLHNVGVELRYIDYSQPQFCTSTDDLEGDAEEKAIDLSNQESLPTLSSDASAEELFNYANLLSEQGMLQQELQYHLSALGFNKVAVFRVMQQTAATRTNYLLSSKKHEKQHSKENLFDESRSIIQNGCKVKITHKNAAHYINLIKAHWSGPGLIPILRSFMKGLSEVLGVLESHCLLSLFSPSELTKVFCGKQEVTWKDEPLLGCIVPRGGYDVDSKPIKMLVEALKSMNNKERSLFLSFCTAKSRVPLSGLPQIKVYPPLLTRTSAISVRASRGDKHDKDLLELYQSQQLTNVVSRTASAVIRNVKKVSPGVFSVELNHMETGLFEKRDLVSFIGKKYGYEILEVKKSPAIIQSDPFLRPKATTCVNTLYLPKGYKDSQHLLTILEEAFDDARLGGIHD